MTSPILKRTLALILMLAFVLSTESVLAVSSRGSASAQDSGSDAIAKELLSSLFTQIKGRLPLEPTERQGFLQNVSDNLQSLLYQERGWGGCGDLATTLDKREIDQTYQNRKLAITKGVVAVVPLPASRAQGSKLESPTKYIHCVDSYLLNLWVNVAVLNSNADYARDLAKLNYQLFTLLTLKTDRLGQPLEQLAASAVEIFDKLSGGYSGFNENLRGKYSGGIEDLGPEFHGP